jgi:hypothetical protein
MFHLHLNALSISSDARRALELLTFERRDFRQGEFGSTHFVPKIHMTNHVIGSIPFKAIFFEACEILRRDSTFLGYLEGEHVAAECRIESPHSGLGCDSELVRPFCVLFQNAREWRESEIHVSLPHSETNPNILSYFCEKGFYRAQSEKSDRIFNVFTVQGQHRVIQELYSRVQNDMRKLGRGSILRLKVERSAGHYLSPAFTWFPMQAYRIIDYEESVNR